MLSQELSKELNHQRVRQILSDHIPDDEAKLLSNGRLTCMICQYRPIFDGVKTLSQHRIGKKHLAELGKYLKCKSEHEYKQLKNKQQKECVLKKTPKSDKSQPKYLKRRMILSPSTLLKCVSQGSSGTTEFPKVENLNFVQPSAVTQVKRYLKSVTLKNGFEKSLEQAKDSYSVAKCIQNGNESTHTSTGGNVFESQNQHVNTVRSDYDNSKAEHELRLKMSGWIKDSAGNWIKNPDVEFDSDEDEPPPL